MHNEKNDNNSWMKEPSTKHYQNNFPAMGKNEEKCCPCEGKHTTEKNVREKELSQLPIAWGMEDVRGQQHGHAFLGANLPQKSKLCFPTTYGFSNSNLDSILFPSPCNNYLNQFLVEINDWAQKTKWVVESLMGFPHWLKGLNIPPPRLSLGNHAPVSLMLH